MTVRRRRGGDDQPGVEFIGAEESSAVAKDSPPKGRHQRWYLLLSAAVLIVAALIVGKTRTDDPSASPTPTSTTHSSALSKPAPEPTHHPPRCPSLTSCLRSTDVPVAAAAAVLHEFPDARLGPATTVVLTNGEIWYRQLRAQAGDLNVVVRIQRPEAHPATLGPTRTDTLETYIRQDRNGYVIQIDADGPLPDVPNLARLYRLAADHRLFTPG